MPWVSLALIGLAIAMCLGPVMLMRPSAQHRKQAMLRAMAVEMGLRVSSGSIIMNGRSKTYCVYTRPWQEQQTKGSAKTLTNNWCLVKNSFEHKLHFYKAWDFADSTHSSLCLEPALGEWLDMLPPSVVAVECRVSGLGAYWSEQGGQEGLRELNATLERFSIEVHAKKCDV